MSEPDVPRTTDACAMIARCHRHQYPHEYGRPAVNAVWSIEEATLLVPMIVDHDPGGPAC